MVIPDHVPSAGPRLARAAGRFLFGQDAAGYHAARLDYPKELYRRIFEVTGESGLSILEIGGGTGLATARLLATGPRRLAVVEPDGALASLLRGQLGPYGVEIVEHDFLAAPIDGRFNLIAAAASFHWLDPQAALDRARALLRPGGCIAVWWNVYRQRGIGDAFADHVTPLLAGLELPPSEGADGHYSLDTALHRAQFSAADFTVVVEEVFRRTRILSSEQVRALYATYSFVRAMSVRQQAKFLAEIEQIARTMFGDKVPNVVLSPLYIAQP